MFIGDEILVEAGFDAACSRLAGLVRGGGLVRASAAAYRDGLAELAQDIPSDLGVRMAGLAGFSRLDLVVCDGRAVLALRWQVVSPGGGLTPVLDADLTLRPAGASATVAVLAGVYRVPPGLLDARAGDGVLGQVAAATVRAFLRRVSAALTQPLNAAAMLNLN